MKQLHYITGAAGTGKTFELANALVDWCNNNSLLPHQKILALTKMHGSRKRLNERLATNSIHSQITISTIDSFALALVNRWRLSWGYVNQIVPSEHKTGLIKDELGLRASFDEIKHLAATLLSSPIVTKTVANSYPLILVDEFQDCDADQLSIISNLYNCVDLILAADPFQALNGKEDACEWVNGLIEQSSPVLVRQLDISRRTTVSYIHEASQALIENRPASYCKGRLPFLATPTYGLAPWKLIPGNMAQGENSAIIYPASRALRNLLSSVTKQNDKRKLEGKSLIFFPWEQRLGDKELEERMFIEFSESIKNGTWKENKKWRELYNNALHLAKVKGINLPSDTILEQVVNGYVQARKFINYRSTKYEATTIHGAKNREFDHVFVFWDDNLCGNFSNEEKRRLLYNAITRAKKSCKVIVIGTAKSVADSPVLSLLGTPITQ